MKNALEKHDDHPFSAVYDSLFNVNVATLRNWVCRDSSVDIVTLYGLDGPGIESRWGARFSALVQTGPGAHPPSSTMGTGSFLGVKRPGRGADYPSHLSAEVMKGYGYTSTHPLDLSGRL